MKIDNSEDSCEQATESLYYAFGFKANNNSQRKPLYVIQTTWATFVTSTSLTREYT